MTTQEDQEDPEDVEDVLALSRSQRRNVTKREAREILKRLERGQGAQFRESWNILEYYMDEVIGERKK